MGNQLLIKAYVSNNKYTHQRQLYYFENLPNSDFPVIQRTEIRLNAVFHSSKAPKTSIMKMLEIRYQICSGIGEDFSAMLCKSTHIHTSIISQPWSYYFCATSRNNNLL